MIHTMELIQEIPQYQVRDVLNGFDVPYYKIDRFYRRHGGISSCSNKLSRNHPTLGVKKISVIKQQDTITTGISYYCILRVEPQMLLMQEKTVELFEATIENVQRLSDNFHTAMNLFVEDTGFENIVDLSRWKCRRIDYTVNLSFASDAEAQLFLELIKKTSRYIRTKKKMIQGISARDQSTAEGNGSTKTIFYDKAKQIRETYGGISVDEMNRLTEEANGTIRFEVQCKKQKVLSLKKRYGLSSRGILGFLNEDISHELLSKRYEQAVGEGDFYSLYHAKNRISRSSFGSKKQSDLVHVLQLIAQARHVDMARDQFIVGKTIKRTDIVVKGSQGTFNNRLKDITSLDVNPVLIPKERKVTFLHNPIDQIR